MGGFGVKESMYYLIKINSKCSVMQKMCLESYAYQRTYLNRIIARRLLSCVKRIHYNLYT